MSRSTSITACLRLVAISLTVTSAVATGGAAHAFGDDPTAVTPAEVFARLAVVRTELEVLRHAMGRPRVVQPEIEVRGAAPREVYFQAMAFFRNAERFCFDHTREHADPPVPPMVEIGPADVLRVVDASLDRLRRVRTRNGIAVPSRVEPIVDGSKTPTDVFRAVVQANRQLNLLLDERVAPSDVFERVTVGVGYAARLLERFPENVLVPEAPEFEIGKTPSDVYRRLLACFVRVRAIADRSGLPMLELTVAEDQIADAEPSDVYHLAALLVSELAYLHSRLPTAEPPREVYYVGRKFPSHVYQRAGVLELQLTSLEAWIAREPGGLLATGRDE